MLPWFAAWIARDLAVFERFPGMSFLAATVAATLVGRLSASVVATISSAVLVTTSRLLPGGLDNLVLDLLALTFFVAVSFTVAYALALKDAAGEQAAAVRSEIERLADELATERNTMQQMLQQMPNGVMVVDVDGKLTFTNTRAETSSSTADRTGHLLDEPVVEVLWTARRPDGTSYDTDEHPLARSAATGEIVIGETMMVQEPTAPP